MKVATRPASRTPRVALAALTSGALFASPLVLASPAQAADESGWTYTVQTVQTPIAQGYQSVFDPVNRVFYRTDAQARSDVRSRETVYNDADEAIGWRWVNTSTGGSAKVVAIDAATKTTASTYDYTNLTRLTGKKESEAHSWDGIAWSPNSAGTQSQSSLRTHFSPNGIAVDTSTETIITTHVRQQLNGNDVTQENGGTNYGYGGGIVIFGASQGAPTDADRLWKLADGSPILDNARQVAVNSKTHKAYIASMGAKNGSTSRPGHITVIDLATKTVESRIAIPFADSVNDATGDLASNLSPGAIDVTVDEENEIVYAGLIVQNGGAGNFTVPIVAIDAADATLDKSNPIDFHLNDDKIDLLSAKVTHNARPTYDATTKKLYVASYSTVVKNGTTDTPNGQISVVDADPASANYGKVEKSVQVNYINSVAVDPKRGLLYAAENSARKSLVYKLDTLEKVLEVPSSGRTNDLGVDPVTGEVWVGMFSFQGADASKTDVFKVFAPGVTAHGNDASQIETSNTSSVYGKAGRTTVVVTDEDGEAASGTVTATVGGTKVSAKLKRGEASFALPATLTPGKHAVTFAYSGNATLSDATASATHTVAKGTIKLTKKSAVIGKAKVGKKLKVTAPRFDQSAVKVSYQWTRNGKAIKGATKATYAVKKADRGKKLAVIVRGTKTHFTSVVTTTAGKKVAKK